MVHLLNALPHLRAAGWEVEAWCVRSDAPPEAVRHTFFRVPKWLGPLELLYFTVAVNLYGLWRKLSGRPISATVIHATCGTYFGANLISIHFVNIVWAAVQLRLGIRSVKETARFVFSLHGVILERLAWWSPSVKIALAVSESIAAEVRARGPASLAVEVFPNSYDETRFHSGVREQYRAALRAELQLTPENLTFIFVSQGHHERKGFWLAVDALARLRRDGRKVLRFLVAGGSAETLNALQDRLAKEVPDWADWILFVGMQTQVEKYYAAADAFLFPSYFEAFSLAEIEAAACGLPLLLTPHHGSEMVLEDGINGFQLSSEPVEMSRQIARFADAGLPPFAPGAGRGLNRRAYAAALLAVYERVWLAASTRGSNS